MLIRICMRMICTRMIKTGKQESRQYYKVVDSVSYCSSVILEIFYIAFGKIIICSSKFLITRVISR